MALMHGADKEAHVLLKVLSVLAIAALMALTVWTGSR